MRIARRRPSPPHSLLRRSLVLTTLIVFSHLRWNFVYQRPQQLLSRLARRFPVVFLEEPMQGAAADTLECLYPCAGVEVLRPHLHGGASGFHDDHIPTLRMLLANHLETHAINDYWLWFYTPMAMPLATGLPAGGVVYDCMDELAAFRHAPRQLLQRENALFRQADLVFAGGQSLYESKRDRHAAVHCLPSSVDAAHFAPVAGAAARAPATGRANAPRIGYYGVIDERMDLELVDALARARPDWDIVMVGPVVKIDPASLPRSANLHWLGPRDYAELPALVAGWDVCMMPFALNEATRFISPTKTLEYLAADKPVVSTPIRDVVEPYAGVVAIAATPAEFVAACERALARTPGERRADADARASVVVGTSWDKTAARMIELIDEVRARRRRRAARGSVQQASPLPPARPASAVA